MRILKIEPFVEPYEIEIPDSLESLQKEVGGWIEAVYPSDDMIAVICNEEGKMNGMELNHSVYDDAGNRIDIIAGPFLVVGLSDDSFVSLPDELMQKYKEQFRQAEMFVMDGQNGEIRSIKFEANKAETAIKPPEHVQEDHSER